QRSDGGMDKTFTYPENSVLIRFDYYIMAHFSKFIKRGAKRIQSSARTPWLISEVSFLNPDGTIVSIITNRRRQPVTVMLQWHELHARLDLPPRTIITARWQSQTPRTEE
nr:glycoside hydrolase family 30 beta sandwich domain-containing protein [Candidatus Sigynarchaeota archaeon]